MNLQLWSGEAGRTFAAALWLGIGFLLLQLFQERLGFCWWCGAVERQAHAVLACGLKRCQSRLMRVLLRLKLRVELLRLHTSKFCLNLLNALIVFREGFLDVLFTHRISVRLARCEMPNDQALPHGGAERTPNANRD